MCNACVDVTLINQYLYVCTWRCLIDRNECCCCSLLIKLLLRPSHHAPCETDADEGGGLQARPACQDWGKCDSPIGDHQHGGGIPVWLNNRGSLAQPGVWHTWKRSHRVDQFHICRGSMGCNATPITCCHHHVCNLLESWNFHKWRLQTHTNSGCITSNFTTALH